MDSKVREAFDRLAAEYDELKLRVIPGYHAVQELVSRHGGGVQPGRILELGCGTGPWAAAFLAAHEDTRYEAVEFSERMREIAAERLAPYAHRVRLLDRDLNSSLPDGPYDLVVSFYAIHHVRDKQRLIAEVFARLSPGGRFLFADITVSGHPKLEEAFLSGWVTFMGSAGLDPRRIPEVLADHRENDLPETPERQLRLLAEAGFDPVRIIWRWEKFVLFYAEKPGDA